MVWASWQQRQLMDEVPRDSREHELRDRGKLLASWTYLKRDHRSVVYVSKQW